MTAEAPGDTILVVEDEPDIRDILCLILEDRGHHAIGAADGQDALDYLHHNPPPSLVILDLMMPRMDGWQFRAAQLADPRLASIPVLVLSGDGQVSTKAAALAAAGYIRKPVDLPDLLRSIDLHRQPPPTPHGEAPPR
jgi:two-component system, chemotaxis family, chemotaxis protein CheY